MQTEASKVMALDEAVTKYVTSGSHLAIGGFTVNRNPMAAVYEIMRQKITDLHVYAHSNGQGVDELIGGGCVRRLEIAYAGTGRFAPTCIRFRQAAEKGTLQVEDYSNYQMTLRFTAGAMGVPFLPTRSGLGSEIMTRWGIDEASRRRDPKLPDQKIMLLDNPFTNEAESAAGLWNDTAQVVAVPAINPDVTIIHAQKADVIGNLRIEGLCFADVEQVKAARHVIVTCETLVATEQLKAESDRNQIPAFCVDAVVPVKWGAYPTACYRYYDYDPLFLSRYGEDARDESRYAEYLERFIYTTTDHAEFIALQDAQQMDRIKADPRTGYAVGLKR